ncbi:MAG: sugar ABC transporter ATP-binding protein [Spirochaetia bacterium]|jgi:ribose transport system ATP-binding protein|nr:sugar ABC transporter ATP-binding protein [Spirochaetia bacterium]
MLDMQKIEKRFGPVHALKGVDFQVFPHEIVGLVGENGAGKSTLMKVLLGIHEKDGGTILIDGKPIGFSGPKDANTHGICMVFQEQSLLANMAVYENMFLGFEHLFMKNGLISKKKMLAAAAEELSRIGLMIDPDAQISKLNFVQRQMIEVIRNIWKANKSGAASVVVALDEPTSALGEKDSNILFSQMEELRKMASIVFISHKLGEIARMCDRTYVLKDGENSGVFERRNVSEDVLRTQMVGGVIEGEYYLIDQQRRPGEKVVLEVKNLNRQGAFEDISFLVHEGEVFCISGAMGSGKEALCDVLYGLERYDSGSIILDGSAVYSKAPNEAVKQGIGFSPDDRKGKALIMGMSVADNIAIPLMKGVINPRKLAEVSRGMIDRLKIKTPSERTLIRNLSGGNQQKAIMARLMLTNAKLVILSHPTRGVDVGAKREIYALIREMARRGTAVILMGDSFEEDIGLSNNIMTMKDRRCTGILNADDRKPTLEEFVEYIV